ncbi:MAG: hypothetical protein U9R49_15100 [Bacteroidota bacterium]|nr:hypothetical protein [Bacteroidota bacterium]
MRISRLIRISFLLFALIVMSCMDGFSQIHRIGGGLTFSSGTDFNYGETGNPGIVVKTGLALNKASTLHIVPSVTAYNRYKVETGYSILTNLMFQGDVDLQYTFFQEGNVKSVAFAGGDVTYLNSDYEPLIVTGNETITDTADFAIGGNVGAALELRMAPKWDFNISGKYIFSQYSQFIISVQAVYYFKSRRRSYRR